MASGAAGIQGCPEEAMSFMLRTALQDSPQGPQTANRQLLPIATNRHAPTANRPQLPTFEVEKVP